jgi:hypothetical protein
MAKRQLKGQKMNTPWMFVTGCAMIGFLLPESLAAFGKGRVPIGMNMFSAAAVALIAASFVY